MSRPILALAILGALVLAGCTATNENADDGGVNPDQRGSYVEGTMEVTEGEPPANDTNTTAPDNSTNTSS